MTKRINVPPMSEKPTDQSGLVSRIWHRFFVDLQKAVNASSDANIDGLLSNVGGGAGMDSDVTKQQVFDGTSEKPGLTDTEVMRVFDSAAGEVAKHAATHTDGEDDIQDATNAIKGLMTPALVTEIEELDYVQAPTILTGDGITGGTNAGTYKVSALTAKLRATNSTIAELVTVTLAEQDNQAIPAENITYFVNLEYNDGDPVFECSVDLPNLTTAIPIGRVMYDGTELHRTLAGFHLAESAKKLFVRAFKLRSIELVPGTSTISYLATDILKMTEGAAYFGGNYVSAGAVDSSVTPFVMIYQDGAGGWKEGNPLTGTDIAFVDGGGGNDSITQTAAKFIKAGYVVGDELTIAGSANNNITTEILALTAGTIEVGTGLLTTEGTGPSVTLKAKKHTVDFAHYDDGTGELALIKNSKYGAFWVWRHADDGDVYVVYGRGSYSLAAAESASIPTHPGHLDDFGAWIGTFGMPYGGGAFSYILMAGTQSFSGEAVGDHALLSNLLIADAGHTVSATDKLLGRSTAGAGVVEEIPLTAAGRALIDDADTAAQRATLDVDQAGADNSTDVTLHASATTGGLSLTDQEISNRAATNAQTGYATDAHITAIEANTAKDTNVSTTLEIGTKTGTTVAITSDGGVDDVTLPAATTTEAGLMTEAQFDKLAGIATGADVTEDNLIISNNFLRTPVFRSADYKSWAKYGTGTFTWRAEGDDWALPNVGTGDIRQGAPGSGAVDITSEAIPVIEGESYCLSLYTLAHRCNLYVDMIVYNKDDDIILDSPQPATAWNNSIGGANGQELKEYIRVYNVLTMPTNAAYVKVRLVKEDTTAGELHSYAFFQYFQFEKTALNQTTPSPWVGSTIEIDDGADVTADNTAAAILNQGDLATQDTADWDTDIDNIPPIAYGAYCVDPTNICADSNFARTTGSSDNTFWLMTDSAWAATYGYNNSEGVRLTVNAIGNTTDLTLRNNDSIFYLPAINGNTYHFKIRVKKDAAHDASLLRLLARQYDKDQAYLASVYSTNITFAAADTWYVKTDSITLTNANCHSIQLCFRVSGGTAGYVYFDDIWIGRVAL
ncbi:MAG: hypothetical protein J7K40_09450 [candidate division Zixibacteria bacterium]|nr:hypothetical protein [candidate division Zixibacteria bacterium]